MKRGILFILGSLLLSPLTYGSEVEDMAIVALKADHGQQPVQTIVSMDEQKLETSFLAASTEVGQLIKATTEGLDGDMGQNFKLAAIDVEFSFGASGGFVLFSAGVEGGVTLHYEKKEQ